jgi:hypothetical protein
MRSWPTHTLVLALALALPRAAWAIDLTTYLEAWTVTVDGGGGTDDADAAWGVAVTLTDSIVVAGTVDGAAPGDGHEAFLAELDTTGSELWRDTLGGGASDAWFDVGLDPLTDDLVLCGTVGDPTMKYRVEVRDAGSPPVSRWSYVYQDGAQSEVQECRAASFFQGNVYSTGWADSGAENGRWLTFRHSGLDGSAFAPPLTMDDAAFESVPDRANGLAINGLDGAFVAVGEQGVSGAVGSDLDDTNLHVMSYDAAQALSWELTVAGGEGLLDVAEDVLVEASTGHVYVVGWLNQGSDNAAGRDRDWYVAKLDAAGNGAGSGLPLWTSAWESVTGADEIATSAAFDDAGDLLVAGTSVDAASGHTVFTVHRFAGYDGTLVDSWIAPAGAGDMVPTAVDFRNGLLALAGWEDTGAGVDLRVTMLDVDGDGDGVADAADACPDDSDKALDEGVCGCGVLDNDTDSDGTLNCEDACPSDPLKFEDAGVCGCDESDADTDTDGAADCVDDCPTDPNKADGVGECGCGSPDTDSDGDGVLGCNDACANTPPDTRVDEFGCPRGGGTTTEETGTTADTDDSTADDKGGCGCDAGGAALPGAALFLAPLLWRRRRQG